MNHPLVEAHGNHVHTRGPENLIRCHGGLPGCGDLANLHLSCCPAPETPPFDDGQDVVALVRQAAAGLRQRHIDNRRTPLYIGRRTVDEILAELDARAARP